MTTRDLKGFRFDGYCKYSYIINKYNGIKNRVCVGLVDNAPQHVIDMYNLCRRKPLDNETKEK